MENPTPAEAPARAAACQNLRTKGMYVFTDGSRDQDQEHDDDSSVYWCLKTMKDYGPDDDIVTRVECCNPKRSCYEGL